MKQRLIIIMVLALALLVFTAVQAQEGQPTLTPDEHAEHHPTEEVTTTTVPDTSTDTGMGQPGHTDMMSMMDMMMGMEMSDEMRTQMEQMLGMMDMMMSGGMTPGLDATPDATSSMDTDYSVTDLAPLALAYYDGEEVYFIHPEASDEGVAQILTDMMGPDVIVVPTLAEIPEELLGNVYVFTNGIEAMGPLGYQPDVFDSVPGDETYTPLRAINLVTWQASAELSELTSVREILTAEENGEIIIERPGVVVNMPILVWSDGQR